MEPETGRLRSINQPWGRRVEADGELTLSEHQWRHVSPTGCFPMQRLIYLPARRRGALVSFLVSAGWSWVLSPLTDQNHPGPQSSRLAALGPLGAQEERQIVRDCDSPRSWRSVCPRALISFLSVCGTGGWRTGSMSQRSD